MLMVASYGYYDLLSHSRVLVPRRERPCEAPGFHVRGK